MHAWIEKILLLALALLTRLVFFIYTVLAWLALPLALALLAVLFWASTLSGWAMAGLATILILSAWKLLQYPDFSAPFNATAPNSVANRLADRFISWIGTLKFFQSPICLVEDPGSYLIKGAHIRMLLDGGMLQPGDILLRGYRGYLDGELIRRTGGAQGAGTYFSHAALYVGPLNAGEDRDTAASAARIRTAGGWRPATPGEQESIRNSHFQDGPQVVLHAMAKGVHTEDILTFLRCDYLAVLRLPETVQLDSEASVFKPLALPDQTGRADATTLDTRLCAGESIPREEVVAMAKQTGLAQIGASYDFLFEEDFNRFSCSEFVYYCFAGVHRYIGLVPKKHSIAGLFARQAVTPPDIYGAGADSKLTVVWSNVDDRQ